MMTQDTTRSKLVKPSLIRTVIQAYQPLDTPEDS